MKDSATATERVGRYQLLEPIGGGPNGMVARAKVFGVAGFERQFAVKRFHADLTTGAAAPALSAAARSYGSLEHPRIARMSEFGVAQGVTFTAVEYVAGLDAFRLLTEAKLAGVAIAAGGALALVSQAARAVGYAHGRGLSHLGLSPTNVIVTADGDVKVTDFGILAATMLQRPTEIPRLASRIPYMSPEQVSGEATSAATDVFVLGVIAYELVTGQRAYRGDTPAAVAQAILAGPPVEPPLPRPIVRVLQRCLARSPFERFPDARALADALDAALRVAPVPGTRKDVGAQVKTTLDRYQQLNEGNVSGMVALNMGGRPESLADDGESASRRPEARTEPSAMPTMAATPTMPATSGLAMRPSAMSTVPGLPPPPIPATPSPKKSMSIPSIPKMGSSPAIPTPPSPPAEAKSLTQGWDAVEGIPDVTDALDPSTPVTVPDETATSLDQGRTVLGLEAPSVPRAASQHSFESTTGEMSLGQLDELNKRAQLKTSELVPMDRADTQAPTVVSGGGVGIDDDVSVALHAPEPDLAAMTLPGHAPAPARPESMPEWAPTGSVPLFDYNKANTPTADQIQTSTPDYPPAQTQPGLSASDVAAETPSRPVVRSSKLPVVAGILAVALVGVAGYWVFTHMGTSSEAPVAKTQAAAVTRDAAVAVAITPAPDAKRVVLDAPVQVATIAIDAASAPVAADAAVVAAVSVDAALPVDAAGNPEGTAPAVASSKSDQLEVTSTPSGARVFVDGSEIGKTPVKTPGSADRHTLAVLLPGHDLYLAEVDGSGVYNVTLEPVKLPKSGPGIKVETCKGKDRYYIYVDGKPSGQTCPTEKRIVASGLGAHTVEVYDIVTETKKKYSVDIKDDRLSVRVKLEE